MPFSWLTFLTLLAIVAATFGITEFLAGRWTIWRRYFRLRDWGKSRRLRLVHRPLDGSLPETLPPRIGRIDRSQRVRWHFTDGRLSLMRLQAASETYNLLLLSIVREWPATALRATQRETCLVDRLGLFNYPSPLGIERFTLHGEDPPAARRLNESHVRGLLPRDLSLLLDGKVMVIEFSTRPFDPIELDRMIALANQLSIALPPPAGEIRA